MESMLISPQAKITSATWRGEHDTYTETFVAFSDCAMCKGEGYRRNWSMYSNGIPYQCSECEWRNEKWKRSYPTIYRIARKRWYAAEEPVWNKKLNRLEWKEVKHHAEKTQVYGYALINGKLELIWLDWRGPNTAPRRYELEFKNIEEAQTWIAKQHNGDIRNFWTGL